MVFPGLHWKERLPANQGINSLKLEKALRYLSVHTGGVGVDETVIVRNGYLIWKGSSIDKRHTIDSCTKTFTATVLGLLIKDGTLSLDSFAKDYSGSLATSEYPPYLKISLRHLASMTSGYDADTTPLKDLQWGDPEKFLTPLSPLFEPGNSFKYHDPAVHQLGYILTRMAGESLESIFRRRIADPIGMTIWDWTDYGTRDGLVFNNPSGIYGGGIHISARDLARFGHLYLNRGKWKGEQLLPQDWVDQATSTQVPASTATKYFNLTGRFGFMWWTNGFRLNGDGDGVRAWPSAPPKTYVAHGAGRNFCFVIPEWSMVVVRMDNSVGMPWRNQDHIWNTFFKMLGAAVTGD